MPDNFADAFDAPFVEMIRGEQVTFPRLTIRDYKPWASELHGIRKKRGKDLIPAGTPVEQRVQLLRQIEHDVPGLGEISSLVYSIDGAIKVLEMSLAKAGKSKDEAATIIDRIAPAQLTTLAQKVSGLFTFKDPTPEEKKRQGAEDADPNDDDGDATGTSTAAS